MYGDCPITVELDAQISRLVAEYSKPPMLAPVGAPTATSAASLLFIFESFLGCVIDQAFMSNPFTQNCISTMAGAWLHNMHVSS